MSRDIPARVRRASIALALCATTLLSARQSTPGATTVDLMTDAGVAQFKGQWRYKEVTIVEVSSAETEKTIAEWTDAQMKGGGGYRPTPPVPVRKTYDIQPKAGAANYDDASWEVIPAATLPMYRSGGQLCFGWYRITLTMPETVNGVSTAGAKAFLNVNPDDYGEVWVNGRLPRSLKPPNPHLISGWNQNLRVPLTDAVKPGERIQVAVFVMNGPISDTPTNRIFIRAANLEIVR